MKIISYSLFKGPDPLAELFYVRGLYFNVMMNSIVYPEWKTVVHVCPYIYKQYYTLFGNLSNLSYPVDIRVEDSDDSHCMKMLWRMKPIFDKNVEYLICRDSDALTSNREAKAVGGWVKTGLTLHGLHDNPAHSIPLLGGMCGFKCEPLRDKYGSFEIMIGCANNPIDKHGSDQVFLNNVVYPGFKTSMAYDGPPMLGPRSHPSDLCTSFIGAAGCNEMETLRYLRDVLPNWGADNSVLQLYPKIFYWV